MLTVRTRIGPITTIEYVFVSVTDIESGKQSGGRDAESLALTEIILHDRDHRLIVIVVNGRSQSEEVTDWIDTGDLLPSECFGECVVFTITEEVKVNRRISTLHHLSEGFDSLEKIGKCILEDARFERIRVSHRLRHIVREVTKRYWTVIRGIRHRNISSNGVEAIISVVALHIEVDANHRPSFDGLVKVERRVVIRELSVSAPYQPGRMVAIGPKRVIWSDVSEI